MTARLPYKFGVCEGNANQAASVRSPHILDTTILTALRGQYTFETGAKIILSPTGASTYPRAVFCPCSPLEVRAFLSPQHCLPG